MVSSLNYNRIPMVCKHHLSCLSGINTGTYYAIGTLLNAIMMDYYSHDVCPQAVLSLSTGAGGYAIS